MFIQIAFGQCLMFIEGRKQRMSFCLIMGLFIQSYVFGKQIAHIYIMAYVGYAMMKFLPRTEQHMYVCYWALGYLSCQFLYAMYTEFGGFKMDSTSYTMFVCTKIWTLAWSYRDGAVDDKLLNEGMKERRVHNLPSVFEFTSYIAFAPGCLCGPNLEYTDFENWAAMEADYKSVP